MTPTRAILPATVLLLGACSAEPPAPQFRSYDLDLVHPSPNSTYLMVAPGTSSAKMPKPRHLRSRGFSRYLRAATGCGIDTAREPTVLGHRRAPAGYMVPIVCP